MMWVGLASVWFSQIQRLLFLIFFNVSFWPRSDHGSCWIPVTEICSWLVRFYCGVCSRPFAGRPVISRTTIWGWISQRPTCRLLTAECHGGVAFDGDGGFGVTDIFYVAARVRSADVVTLLLDHAMSSRCSMNCCDGDSKYCLVVNIVIMIWKILLLNIV
jgi:hypothetical protein